MYYVPGYRDLYLAVFPSESCYKAVRFFDTCPNVWPREHHPYILVAPYPFENMDCSLHIYQILQNNMLLEEASFPLGTGRSLPARPCGFVGHTSFAVSPWQSPVFHWGVL